MLGLLALAAVPALGWSGQRLAESRDRRRFPMPGRLIDVDGERIHVIVEGSGPVVLFDSGLGGGVLEWAAVAAELTRDFTVVRYDRPGFGWSPSSTRARTPLTAAERIHAILATLEVPLPAVLVGHSLGGLHVRVAAALHPDAVRGLVLVDPSHEDMLEVAGAGRSAAITSRVMTVVGATAPLGSARIVGRLYGRMVAGQVRATLDAAGSDALSCATSLNACSVAGMRASVMEMAALPQALRQVKEYDARHPLPPITVTVISADATPRTKAERVGRAAIRELHEKQAAAMPRGRLVLAANSGHLVPLDEPALVAACIRDVIS